MRSLKDSIFLKFKGLRLWSCQCLISLHKIIHWDDDHILNVLDQSTYEWGSYVFDSALDPDIVMKEVSLACQDTQMDCKVIVVTIHDCKEAIFHLLSDVQDSWQVHQSLVMLAELTDSSDEKGLVLLE